MLLIVCIGLPVLAIGGWFASVPIRHHKKAQGDATAIFQALNAYVSEQGELPKGSFSVVCRLLRGESVEGQNLKHLDYIEAEGAEVNAKGELIDPWGNAYRISLEGKLRVYSCGPNGVDDQGKGDDIVVQ